MLLRRHRSKRIMKEDKFEEKKKVVKTKKSKINYNKHTVEELKDFARDRELTGYSTKTKKELIQLLEGD